MAGSVINFFSFKEKNPKKLMRKNDEFRTQNYEY